MLDDRPGAFDREPRDTRPLEMSPEEFEAAGLRWMTREESAIWQGRVLNGLTDEDSWNRALVGSLPMARQRLAAAIAGLEDQQLELRTKTRTIRSPRGEVTTVPSPYFVDGQGRDEPYWRDQAATLKADIAKAVKTGPSADEAALEALCYARLSEATALNTADRVRFNEVILRRSVGDARENVRTMQAELTRITRLTAPYMDA